MPTTEVTLGRCATSAASLDPLSDPAAIARF
jgi:hypothetical protein